MAILGHNRLFKAKFSEFFNFNRRYCTNSMPICPVTKKNEFTVSVTKTPTFFAAILRPFGPGVKILTHDI